MLNKSISRFERCHHLPWQSGDGPFEIEIEFAHGMPVQHHKCIIPGLNQTTIPIWLIQTLTHMSECELLRYEGPEQLTLWNMSKLHGRKRVPWSLLSSPKPDDTGPCASRIWIHMDIRCCWRFRFNRSVQISRWLHPWWRLRGHWTCLYVVQTMNREQQLLFEVLNVRYMRSIRLERGRKVRVGDMFCWLRPFKD